MKKVRLQASYCGGVWDRRKATDAGAEELALSFTSLIVIWEPSSDKAHCSLCPVHLMMKTWLVSLRLPLCDFANKHCCRDREVLPLPLVSSMTVNFGPSWTTLRMISRGVSATQTPEILRFRMGLWIPMPNAIAKKTARPFRISKL